MLALAHLMSRHCGHALVLLVAAQLLHQLPAVQRFVRRPPRDGLDHLLPHLLLEARLHGKAEIRAGSSTEGTASVLAELEASGSGAGMHGEGGGGGGSE